MTVEFTAEQQAEIDRIVGRTRLESRDRARKEIEEETKAAEAYETKIKELEEQVGNYKKRENEVLSATLESMVSKLSEADRKAIESMPGDTEAKIAWLSENQPLFEKHGDGVGNRSTEPAKAKNVETGYIPRKGW